MKRLVVASLALAITGAFAQTTPAPPDKIAAMLNSAPPETTTLDGVVLSSTAGGDVRLQSVPGSFSTTYAFVTVLMFMDYPGMRASVRTTDTHPTLHVKMGANPTSRVYLVKVQSNPKTTNRSLKLGHSGFGSVGGMTAPDSKWSIPFTVTQESLGVWKLTPTAPLVPGEYGVFTPHEAGGMQIPASGDIYDFGVD